MNSHTRFASKEIVVLYDAMLEFSVHMRNSRYGTGMRTHRVPLNKIMEHKTGTINRSSDAWKRHKSIRSAHVNEVKDQILNFLCKAFIGIPAWPRYECLISQKKLVNRNLCKSTNCLEFLLGVVTHMGNLILFSSHINALNYPTFQGYNALFIRLYEAYNHGK